MNEIGFNDITKELSQNFIEYAAAVNSDRAIPDSATGLKPVARRILWSAYEGGRLSSKPHVKAARIVGDTMGKYHPHGDSSIYEAMVRLSQDWVMRYPLMDFHGNNGNIGGDGPAAHRYTEARLAKISEQGLLCGIKKQNVDFIPNYDETTEEPKTLPSIFPNLLCNPNKGIGVAMACNWLPHNLNEVAVAINDYLDGKEPMLPGPDFPTGGIILNKNDIPNIMKTGNGSVKIRAKYKVDKKEIIIYEIPYGQTLENLMDEIGEVSDKKEVEGIVDIRNESDMKGIRLIIECDKSTNPDGVMSLLFAKTKLQTSISYNQVALVDKTPTELNLKQCIEIYVKHNIECIKKEAIFDLNKANARKEIVEGLLKALEDIDNIITLIKKSQSSIIAKERLIEKYKFSEVQAKAILDMRLSKLAGLEKIELQNENAELAEVIKQLNNLIINPNLQQEELKKRLNEIVKKFGDERRTELIQLDITPSEKELETVIPEDCVVIVSQSGLIKRVPKTNFKVQKRNGKGVKNEDGAILTTISTNTIDNLMIFTSKGKMYKLLVDKVPTGTNTSKGIAINQLINMDFDETVEAVTSLYRESKAKYVVFITKAGLIKKTLLEEYTKIKRSTGIVAIKLKENDNIANVVFLEEEDLVLITKKGMAIHFETKNINPIGRVTSGVKSIKLIDDDEVLIGLPIHKDTDNIAIFTKKGYGKQVELAEVPIQGRTGKGLVIYKPTTSTGEVAGAAMISQEDKLLLIGKPNSICISSVDVPKISRIGMGNIMVKNSAIENVVKI